MATLLVPSSYKLVRRITSCNMHVSEPNRMCRQLTSAARITSTSLDHSLLPASGDDPYATRNNPVMLCRGAYADKSASGQDCRRSPTAAG
jgi:hypothetical protein